MIVLQVGNRGGSIMLGWVVRGLLIVAGFVASWFVAKDAPQFGLMQMAHWHSGQNVGATS
jgi:hypothetical protein